MANLDTADVKSQLLSTIEQIHLSCHKLCKQALGRYLPIAGNIGVFCHSDDEFDMLTAIREELTLPSDNPSQKYYMLRDPIIIRANGDVPETTYTYLYIRKPNLKAAFEDGDVDFVLSDTEYENFKQSVSNGSANKTAKIYNRPGWDMIELSDSRVNALAYVGTKAMTEKVRVRFD